MFLLGYLWEKWSFILFIIFIIFLIVGVVGRMNQKGVHMSMMRQIDIGRQYLGVEEGEILTRLQARKEKLIVSLILQK